MRYARHGMHRGEPAALTGRTLGDFTVLEKLGEGGYGVVYRAEQRGLGREAVVKVLHARLGGSERTVQRFLREAQLASRLDHPYAAHVYAFGAEPDGVLWIAMELVRGTPLSQVLAAQPGRRMQLTRFVSLLDRICEVVHTAHEQGIVHRDLKPDNIMVLSRAGRLLPKLLDLGVAKLTLDPAEVDDRAAPPASDARLTLEGARVGSPYYMAPEQWTDGEIDARTDLYALGVITHEALLGAMPFSGATVAEIARAHLRGDVPAMSALPEGVAAAVRSALAKDRAARPVSALAFAEAVRAGAGLRVAADALPRLEDDLRLEVAWLPQPIAEVLGALEAARNPHQARDALWQIVHVAARWLGVVALAARRRVGPGPGQAVDAPAVVELLRALPRRELADDEWIELVRGLVRPFAGARDAHPIPELVDLGLADASPFAPLFALRATEGTTTSEESLRDWLVRTLPVLTPLVRALGWLTDYQLVVARDGGAELWMGPRKLHRALVHVDGTLVRGEPALVDHDGRPVIALAPLISVAAPSPGAVEEMFVFAAPGRARGRGARLVADPHGFERHDDRVWDWFRDHLLSVDEGKAAAIEEAPYRGLSAFTEKDAARFFGRERAAESFLNQVLVTPFLAVVGPSGAGKSSFVQAGVLPLLPPEWRHVVLRPGAAPMAVLESRVAATDQTLVVVVDQFEELFTLGADTDERERFAAALTAAARDDRVRVIVTLRDDFLMRAGELPALRDRLAHGLTLLGTPAPEDLLRIVVEPARRAGYDFDDKELPLRMVRAVAGQPGALALLSFTAAQLWDLRDRHFKRLTRAAYEAIGGVEGALAAHADATLAAASADEQRLMRDAFRHLVTAEGTRTVLTRRELDDVLGKSTHAASVVERLVHARLLVASESELGDDRIEIIHEALVTAWPRLVQWRRDDAEGAGLRDQLRAAARQWADRDRARGLLWRDDALDDYRRWRTRWPGALPELDEAFAAASLREAARGRRLRRTLVASVASILIAASIALALLYRSSRTNAGESRDRLVASFVEQGRRLLLDGDYLRALPYLSAAYSAGDDSLSVRFMLHRAMRLADTPRPFALAQPITGIAFRAHGEQVVAAAQDGSAAVWSRTTHTVVASLPASVGADGDPVFPTVSHDGSRAAIPRVADVLLWDGTTSRAIPVPAANRVAFDTAGRRLAIGAGPDLSLWDVVGDGATRVRTLHLDAAIGQLVWCDEAVAVWTVDGAVRLVTADRVQVLGVAKRLGTVAVPGRFATIKTTGVEVWSASGEREQAFETPEPMYMAFDPTGRRIAIATVDGEVLIASLATGRIDGVLLGIIGGARVTFTGDGERIVTAGKDGTVRIWDAANHAELARFVGGSTSPYRVEIDAATRTILVGGADGSVRAFALDDPGAIRSIDAGGQVLATQVTDDGATVATTVADGITIRDLATGAPRAHAALHAGDGARLAERTHLALVPIADTTDAQLVDLDTGKVTATIHTATEVQAVAFDPRGRQVATAGLDGSVDVWSLRGEHVRALAGHHGPAFGVAFDRDGRHLIAPGQDGETIMWDVDSGAVLGRARSADAVWSAVFDGTGSSILTASEDRSVRLWDARTLRSLVTFEQASAPRAAAISPDGRVVAAATQDGTVSVWDAITGHEMGRFHHGAAAVTVELLAGAARMVSGGNDGRVIVWDVGTDVPSPSEVRTFLGCRVPYALNGTVLQKIVIHDC